MQPEHNMNIKFKNPKLNTLVADVSMYSNLLLNDVAMTSDGTPIVKMEKPRSDDKVSRQYYNATFISMENMNKARTVTFWQSHTQDGAGVIWKQLNPAIAAKLLGGKIEGSIAVVKFNEEYQLGDNFVSTATLFVSHPDVLEAEVERFAIQNGLIIEEVKETITDGGEGSDVKEDEQPEGEDIKEEGEELEEVVEGATPKAEGSKPAPKDKKPKVGTN